MKRLVPLLILASALPCEALMLPTTRPLKEKQFSLESHFLAGSQTGLVTRGAAGLGDGLELGLTYFYGYPDPMFAGPGLDLCYQIVAPSWPRPTAVTTGISFLGVAGNSFGLSNNAFLTLSQDFNTRLDGKAVTLGTLRFGFLADPNLRARLLAGFTLPLGELGDVNLDYLGEQTSVPSLLNLGLRYQPVPPVSLFFESLALPGKAWWDRAWTLGIRYLGSR